MIDKLSYVLMNVDHNKDGVAGVFHENSVDLNVIRFETNSCWVPSNYIFLDIDLSYFGTFTFLYIW